MFWLGDIRILILSTRLLYAAETKNQISNPSTRRTWTNDVVFHDRRQVLFSCHAVRPDGSRKLSVTIFNPLLVTWMQVAIAESLSLSLRAIASLEHMCRASHREQPLLAHHLDLEWTRLQKQFRPCLLQLVIAIPPKTADGFRVPAFSRFWCAHNPLVLHLSNEETGGSNPESTAIASQMLCKCILYAPFGLCESRHG